MPTTEAILRYRSEGLEEALDGAKGMGAAAVTLADRTEKLTRTEREADNALKSVFRTFDAGFKQTEKMVQAQDRLNRAFAQGLIDARNHERMHAQIATTMARQIEAATRGTVANDNHARSVGSNTDALRAHASVLDPLASSYGRLIGLVSSLGIAYAAREFVQTVTNFQAIEASLRAATGSTEGAQAAMGYVRAESDRLGLSLASTAKDFAGFAASTRGTELQGQKTQQVFSAIAEAGAVLGLSADDMSGSLRAVTQMVSKGTVASEELRGQLGERLPGAFNIAARAIGVTTAELGKMLENGEVISADFLPKFAEELHRTFGPEAVKASDNLRANINRLGTAITDTYLAAGKGGLTDALNASTKAAAEFLRSNQDTAASVGGALATGLRVGGQAFEFLRRNSDLAGAALAAVIALRHGPALAGIAVDTARAAAMTGVYSIETRGLVASQTAAVASSRALSVAMGAFGGPVGIALTAVAAGVAYLALRQDEGTQAAETQAAGLKQLDAALQQHKGSLASASDETKRLATEQIKAAESAVMEAKRRVDAAQRVADRTQVGSATAGTGEEFVIAAANADLLGRAQADLAAKTEQLAAQQRYLAGTASEADRTLLGLPPTISTIDAQIAGAISNLQRYGDALSKLIAMVPELQKAVDAQGKMVAARSALEEGTLSARRAYLAGDISQNDMVDRVSKLGETYQRATAVVSGFEDAQSKLDARTRSATLGAMKPQEAEVARLRDTHDAYVKSLSEGERASLTAAQRTDLVSKSERTLAQEVANVNTKYAERAAKKAASEAGNDAYDNALQRSRDQVEEFQAVGAAAGKASEEVFRLTEANRLRRVAASAGRADEAGIADEIERQAEAYAKARHASIEAVEAQRRLQDAQREVASQFADFAHDIVLGARTMGEAFDGLSKTFASGTLRALLTGEGPLAGLYGTAPTEKGQLGGLLGGKFDFEKITKAVTEGTSFGLDMSFDKWLEPSKAGGGFMSSPLGGALGAVGGGAAVGYSSGSPLMGALAGLSTGNPLVAVAGPMCGHGGKIGQRRKANDNPKPQEKPVDDRDQRPLAA